MRSWNLCRKYHLSFPYGVKLTEIHSVWWVYRTYITWGISVDSRSRRKCTCILITIRGRINNILLPFNFHVLYVLCLISLSTYGHNTDILQEPCTCVIIERFMFQSPSIILEQLFLCFWCHEVMLRLLSNQQTSSAIKLCADSAKRTLYQKAMGLQCLKFV